VIGVGRKPHRRVADLMIAAISVAENLPLFTANPDDFKGMDDLLTRRAGHPEGASTPMR